jgi:hypothetical protein
MAKLRKGERRIQLSFLRPEDVRLYEFMCEQAYKHRWDVQSFILATLTEVFEKKVEEYEVERLAREAAEKVRQRTIEKKEESEKEELPPPPPPPPPPPRPSLSKMSMEEAARDAEAQIAQLDALAAKMMAGRLSGNTGVPVPPPLPESSKPPEIRTRRESGRRNSNDASAKKETPAQG